MGPFKMHEQAAALARSGGWAQALELETRALELLRGQLPEGDPNLAIVLTNLATYHTEVGQWAEALPLYEEGLAIKASGVDPAHPSLAGTIFRLARCRRMLGDPDEAVGLYRRCVESLRAHPDANPHVHLSALEELAILLQEEGRSSESIPVLHETIGLTASRVLEGERELYAHLRQACLACMAEGDAEGAADALSPVLGTLRAWRLLDELARELVEKARPPLTNVPDPPDDPTWKAEHEVAMSFLGRDPIRAKASAERAVATARERMGPHSLAASLSLNVLAVSHQDLGDEASALACFSASLEAVRQTLGPDHPIYPVSVYNVANCLAKLGRHREAEEALREVLALRRDAAPPDPRAVAVALNDIAELHGRGDDPEAAAAWFAEAAEALGPDDALRSLMEVRRRAAVARSAPEEGSADDPNGPAGLDALRPEHRAALEGLGRAPESDEGAIARKEADRLYAETRSYLPEASFANVLVLCALGKFRMGLGEVPEAVTLLERAMDIARAHHSGPGDPTSGFVAQDLAGAYSAQGRFEDARPLFEMALEVLRALGKGSELSTLAMLSAQGLNHLQLGEYAAAESALVECLDTLRARYPEDKATLAVAGNLAVLYRRMGRYAEATRLHDEVIGGAATVFGPDSPEHLRALNNAGLFFADLGRIDRARDLYERALAGVEATLGLRHADRAMVLNNLALIDSAEGQHGLALERLREASEIRRETLGERHADYLMSLHGVGLELLYLGRMEEAIETLALALRLKREALGPDHVSSAITGSALAHAYDLAGRVDEASPLFDQSLAVRRRVLGDRHPAVARSLGMLAQFHWRRGDPERSRPLFLEAIDIHRGLVNDLFPGMTETERAHYWDTLRDLFEVFTVYALECGAAHPEVLGDLYDVQLFAKAIILESVVTARRQASRSEDPEVRQLYEAWLSKKRQLASLLTAGGGVRGDPDRAAGLRDELEGLEKELVEQSERAPRTPGPEGVTWRAVREKLAPGEVAIEIVRAARSRSDSDAGPFYAALIVRPDTPDHPRLVPIGPASVLEDAGLEGYRELRQAVSDDAYRCYWMPMGAELAASERIYVAPEGVYGQIDPNILHDGDRFLIDAFDIRLVTSTRDLLLAPNATDGRSAVLVGRPAYGEHSDSSPAQFRDLPGTEVEIREIEALLRADDWSVERLLKDEATTARVMGVRNPRVLHIATHGFFLAPQERRYRTRDGGIVSLFLERSPGSEPGLSTLLEALGEAGERVPAVVEGRASSHSGLPDPLLRSGLALAGATHSEDLDEALEDDGLLTAYEATTLQLEGTELVVLSACDSMRGVVRSGEGVIGLERALRAAGARNILATLWSVDDVIARELMQAVYGSWLESGDLRAAVRESQLRLRRRYQLPVLWGGFVLIGA